MQVERRTARRFDISELIFVSSAKETRAGLMRNISRLGAEIEFAEPLGRVPHGFSPGEAIELKIDELGELPGKISRLTDKGVAVAFTIDDQQQEMLRAEIQEAFDAS